MTPEAALRILREGMLLILLLSAAPLLAAFVTGFIASLLQAVTTIQEATLGFVPKLIAIMLTLSITGPWMIAQTVRFTVVLFDGIALVR